jgi:hypothetical protein
MDVHLTIFKHSVPFSDCPHGHHIITIHTSLGDEFQGWGNSISPIKTKHTTTSLLELVSSITVIAHQLIPCIGLEWVIDFLHHLLHLICTVVAVWHACCPSQTSPGQTGLERNLGLRDKRPATEWLTEPCWGPVAFCSKWQTVHRIWKVINITLSAVTTVTAPCHCYKIPEL